MKTTKGSISRVTRTDGFVCFWYAAVAGVFYDYKPDTICRVERDFITDKVVSYPCGFTFND